MVALIKRNEDTETDAEYEQISCLVGVKTG